MDKWALAMFGLGWPPVKGWKSKLIGQRFEIPEDMLDRERRVKLEAIMREQRGAPAPTPATSASISNGEWDCDHCRLLRASGLRVMFVNDELTIESMRTGKVIRLSQQALHGLSRKAG